MLSALAERGYRVSLETSGAMAIDAVDPRVIRVVDVKTPGSGEEHRNRYEQLALLRPEEQIKFVLCDRADYDWSRGKLAALQLAERCQVLFSPSHEQLPARELADWILADRLPLVPLEGLKPSLQEKDSTKEIARLMPADAFYLAAQFRDRSLQGSVSWGPATRELDELLRQQPTDISLKRVSKDFGIPHPILAQTYGRELLNGKPFPAFSGYCNRLFGESWDSDNLYWARLADEMNDSPEMLNILSPQLTRLMISKIFATDIEDWSAVVRAMHETGDETLHGMVALPPATETAAKH